MQYISKNFLFKTRILPGPGPQRNAVVSRRQSQAPSAQTHLIATEIHSFLMVTNTETLYDN